MRTTKELLQVMLENKKCFEYGLCKWALNLLNNGLINFVEYECLDNYIANNRPNEYSSILAYLNRNQDHYWLIYIIKPRIKWIKKHIKKLP